MSEIGYKNGQIGFFIFQFNFLKFPINFNQIYFFDFPIYATFGKIRFSIYRYPFTNTPKYTFIYNLDRSAKSVGFSSLTESNDNYTTLKQSLGITFVKMNTKTIPAQLLQQNEDFTFETFDWGDRTEPQASSDAMKHLQEQLKRVNINRNLFGEDGFTFYDVHQSNQIGFSLDGTRYNGK